MTDKEEYLKDLQEQGNAAQRKNELGLSRFRQASNSSEYKQALTQVSFIKDPADVAKAIELLRNRQEDIAVRTLVLQKTIFAISKTPEYIGDCLAILSDTAEPAVLRKKTLSLLKALSFSSITFVSLRSDYMALLRSLLDDPDSSLREMVAEELAKYKDEFVQRRLLNGLTKQEAPIVNDAKAIQLLGYDIHAEHYPVVRALLQNPASDEVTKLEAIHVLANDPESKQLLINLMLDKTQDKEIRMSSAVGVQSAYPQDFIRIAKPLVLDDGEEKDMRVATLNALMLNRDKTALYADENFLNKVAAVNLLSKSPEVKKMSLRYLQGARKHREQ